MANAFYGKGVQHFANADISWGSDTIKCAIVTTGYTPSINADEFFSSIGAFTGGSVTAPGVALGSKTNSLGTIGAANTLFTSISGSQSAYLVVYKDTGTNTTSHLILLYDTASGLPVTPNGGDITVAWSSGNLAVLFEGLKDCDRALIGRLKKWLRDVLGLGADWDTSKGGLWIPAPKVIQHAGPGAPRPLWTPHPVAA